MPETLIMRTGVHLCTSCCAAVDLDQFLRNDHVCDPCADSDAKPHAGGHAAGFSPIDRPEVRAAIERRGATAGGQP